MMPKDWALRKSRNLLELGISNLKSEKFNDKLDGAKTINEECSKIQSMAHADNIESLVQVLLDAKILELFFNKDAHAQFVKRTDHLLKLLMEQKAITKD